jgi:hypothetical protein
VIGFAVKSPATDETLPGADTLRHLPQIGYAITGTASPLAIAVTIATSSWLILPTAVFGRWLAWLGVAQQRFSWLQVQRSPAFTSSP